MGEFRRIRYVLYSPLTRPSLTPFSRCVEDHHYDRGGGTRKGDAGHPVEVEARDEQVRLQCVTLLTPLVAPTLQGQGSGWG